MKTKINYKKLLGTLLFFGLAILSIFAVTQQNESFSLESLWEAVISANPVMLLLGFCCTIMFVVFEGFAIRCTVREFGQKCSVFKGVVYSATDIYFSAITPSAIGGQPACAYFMMKDGITGGVCAVALLCGLMMYSVSIVIIAVLLLLLCPQVITWFSLPSQLLLLVGAVAQLVLIFVFYMLLWHSKILLKLGTWGLRLLKKIHIIKNYEQRKAKLDKSIETYSEECAFFRQRPKLLIKMFFFNFGQRLALMLVTVFCFLAFTGSWDKVIPVLAIQCMVTVGSNCVPIPGAMGVYDLLLLDGFSNLVATTDAVNMELVSRSLSFYSCLIFCGVIVLLKYLFIKLRDRKIVKLEMNGKEEMGAVEKEVKDSISDEEVASDRLRGEHDRLL